MNGCDIRRCLPIELWPEADKVAWAAAIAPNTVLDDTMGRGALWRKPTRRRVSKCYGRWLSYLIVAGKLIPDDTPTSRIERETVRDYVTLLFGAGPALDSLELHLEPLSRRQGVCPG